MDLKTHESNREDRKSVWETYIVVDIVVVVDFQNFNAGWQGSNKVGIHVTLVVKLLESGEVEKVEEGRAGCLLVYAYGYGSE